jgi:hypothetical protein
MMCAYCYRPAVRTLVAGRRTAWEVVARRPPRRVSVCMAGRCARLAARFLRAYDRVVR